MKPSAPALQPLIVKNAGRLRFPRGFSCTSRQFECGGVTPFLPMSDAAATPPARSRSSSSLPRRTPLWLAAAGLILATVAAFLNSFSGVMVFDDRPSLINNETIRSPGDLRAIFSPPLDTTVSGRPLANATFALNYAISGLEPWSYHAINLLIHVLAALVLWGVVRRTLLLPGLRENFGAHATLLAWVIAVLWAVHPLQTESVTYIVQRVEALVGLFYLLTIDCFVRSTEVAHPAARRWELAAIVACWLGVTAKEVIVSVPLMVLLYDRTLVSESFAGAWRRRRGFYVGLFSSWALLAAMILGAENRSGTAGFGTASSWDYLLTQCRAIVTYLKLVFWPHPQVFDYGKALETDPLAVAPQACLLILLAAGVARALVRRSGWGLPGFLFFAVLAPSSSIVPVATQTMAEHRMYLPLAGVTVACMLGAYHWFGRGALVAGAGAALVLGVFTVKRNEVYRSELALWTATVAVKPDNPRAVCTLGQSLFDAGKKTEAVAYYREALRLSPNYFEALNNLGIAMLHEGKLEEAQQNFEAAVRQRPDYGDVRGNLGMIFFSQGRYDEALVQSAEAVRLLPGSAEMRSNLAIVLNGLGRTDESIAESREALRLKPDYAEAHSNLGMALAAKGESAAAVNAYDEAVRLKPGFADAYMNRGLALWAVGGREEEALRSYEQALRLSPDYFEAHNNLATSLVALGKNEESLPYYEAALRIRPASAQARFNYGNVLVKLRRWPQALEHCAEAVRLRPDHAEARANLGTVLFFTGSADKAIDQLQAALRIDPAYVKAHYFLGNVYASQRRTAEARRHYEEALRLNPEYAPARQNLERLR